jgi:hypothetical protein
MLPTDPPMDAMPIARPDEDSASGPVSDGNTTSTRASAAVHVNAAARPTRISKTHKVTRFNGPHLAVIDQQSPAATRVQSQIVQ